ncbi:hypothetical protein [Rubellimicrobium sp. CFH 75288]|uniref:hypothetical protein n=1 Tax=Rubellimicrobium sp. CFH 75288 TaxID=2697034 RepID=UPI001412FEFD|nr:hypothetical protein [Rubellimicrobium sp. CFH 75288]NAZ37399.1 hypothetical protein [Rubellimicrobium sp. CFH 75288]
MPLMHRTASAGAGCAGTPGAIRLLPEDMEEWGLSGSELLALARLPGHRLACLAETARRHGLEPERLRREPPLGLAAALVCTACVAADTPPDPKAEDPTSGRSPSCGNTSLLRALAAE